MRKMLTIKSGENYFTVDTDGNGKIQENGISRSVGYGEYSNDDLSEYEVKDVRKQVDVLHNKSLMRKNRHNKKKMEENADLPNQWFNCAEPSEVERIIKESMICLDNVFRKDLEMVKIQKMKNYLQVLYLDIKNGTFLYSKVDKTVRCGYAGLINGKLCGTSSQHIALWRHFYKKKKEVATFY